jgi:tRNA A-37 threonylcarbamoyl transferase component Bud32
MGWAAGDRLGPYVILAPLGKGSVGDFYKAHDALLDRDVEIQISSEPFSESSDRAARAAAALNHPHIRKLLDVGPKYLVSEMVYGVPLKGPLSLPESLRFATEICDALNYAHGRGIGHGDLQPSNILITPQGVKILGFGLSRGTPASGPDVASDVRDFGLVLYEMLMGRSVSEKRRPVQPHALENVLQKCLEPEPARRWNSASELKQALGTVSQRGGYRWEYLIAGGSVAMLIFGLGLLVMQFPSHERLSRNDVLVLADFSNTTGDPIFDGTLRAALVAQFGQSSFLKLMDDPQMTQALQRMGRAPETRITNAIAHDICVREGGKAMIGGAIADLGKVFSITLQAVNCRTGATLAREQIQAEGRDRVLKALAEAVADTRVKLGEPPGFLPKDRRSVRPVTGSVAALQFYSMGLAQRTRGNNPASIPFFQHAIDLDPDFALAYLELGRAQAMAGDAAQARKAYDIYFAKNAGNASPVLISAQKEYSELR